MGARLVVLVLLICSLTVVSSYGLIGYYTNWAQYRPCRNGGYKYTPESLIPFATKLTRVNYAFARIATNGSIGITDGSDCATGTWSGCTASSISASGLGRMLAVKRQYNPSLQILVSIGGWSWGAENPCPVFSAMAASQASRETFVRESIAFARQFQLDGIDIDWEYPAYEARGCQPRDTGNFRTLLQLLRQEVTAEAQRSGRAALLITLATPAGAYLTQLLQPGTLAPFVDDMAVMTYDMHGSWDEALGFNAPLNEVEAAIQVYLDAGVPAHKLYLGIPAYGRTWTGFHSCTPSSPASAPGPAQECLQSEGLCSAFECNWLLDHPGTQTFFDDKAQQPYACNQKSSPPIWFSYENDQSIAAKVKYARSKNLAGAMVWALDYDDFPHGYPIFSSIWNHLNRTI